MFSSPDTAHMFYCTKIINYRILPGVILIPTKQYTVSKIIKDKEINNGTFSEVKTRNAYSSFFD